MAICSCAFMSCDSCRFTSQAAVQFAAFAVRLDRLLDRRGTVKLAVNVYDCGNCSASSQPYVTALWFLWLETEPE